MPHPLKLGCCSVRFRLAFLVTLWRSWIRWNNALSNDLVKSAFHILTNLHWHCQTGRQDRFGGGVSNPLFSNFVSVVKSKNVPNVAWFLQAGIIYGIVMLWCIPPKIACYVVTFGRETWMVLLCKIPSWNQNYDVQLSWKHVYDHVGAIHFATIRACN